MPLLHDHDTPGLQRVQMISYLSYTLPSLLGSAFVLLVIVSLKLYSKALNRIVFFISLGDFLLSLPLEFFVEATETTCMIVASIHYYGIISSLYWTSLFAVVFVHISKSSAQLILQKYFKWFLGVGLLLPLPWIAFLGLTRYYDTIIGNFCYHSGTTTFEYQVLVVSVIPPLIAIAVNAVCYVTVFFRLRNVLQGSSHQNQGVNLLALFVFPLILIVCWTPHIVTYVLYELHIDVNDNIQIPLGFLNRLQGILNALFYGLSPVVRQSLRQGVRELCSRRSTNTKERLLFDQSTMRQSAISSGTISDY